MKRKEISTESKPNFGWGKSPKYAMKLAIRAYYNHGQFSTTATHVGRFSQFLTWLRDSYGVRDLRDITTEHAREYFDQKSECVGKKYIKNSITTWNVTMKAVTGEYKKYYIAPVEYSGRISSIRTEEPFRDQTVVWKLIEQEFKGEMPRVAAVIGLARFFAMRPQECLLADLDRIIGESRAKSIAAVLEGCKGGRKVGSRTITILEDQERVLDMISKIRPRGSYNILEHTDLKHIEGRQLIDRANAVLKENDIGDLTELRAAALCDVYEVESGMPIPMNAKPISRELDRKGRAAVARVGGNFRLSTSNAYVGKWGHKRESSSDSHV